MKADYTEFDKELLSNIQMGCNKVMLLEHRMSSLAQPFRKRDPWGDMTPAFRIVDRRLQALRKAGKIRFDGKVWQCIGIEM